MPRLKVLFVASECVPFAKTGGLADVAGALPKAIAARGHDVRVVLPLYAVARQKLAADRAARRLPTPLAVPVGHGQAWGSVWETRLPASSARAYLLEHDELFDRRGIYGDAQGDFGDNLARFTFLSRGALRLCSLLDFEPDVVHVHDWQTSLIPLYLDTLEAHSAAGRAASVLTIHNMGYQGWFNKSELYQTGLGWNVFHARGLEAFDRINLLKGGIYHATMVPTVSPRYAQEIRTPEGGDGLDGVLRDRENDVIGILNGIDDETWNPEIDPYIAGQYSVRDMSGKAECKASLQREMGLAVRPEVPLVGLVSRLAHQKGIDVFAEALPRLLQENVQWVVLGSGESWAERLFTELSRSVPHFRAHIGLSEPLAHKIEAGADFFVMPSRYEPCGLNQLYSQRYGTLPIVRAVGGLDDTVESFMTGFKFHDLTASTLAQTVLFATYMYREHPAHIASMRIRSMSKPFGWDHTSPQYEALYRMAIRRRREGQ
jgi:starch synthase